MGGGRWLQKSKKRGLGVVLKLFGQMIYRTEIKQVYEEGCFVCGGVVCDSSVCGEVECVHIGWLVVRAVIGCM